MLNHSIFSQSYPTQRVEKGDTLIVMTKAQALAMNSRFKSMSRDIDSLKRLHYNTISFIVIRDSVKDEEFASQKKICDEEKKQLKKGNAQMIASSSAFITWVTFIYFSFVSQ